MAKPYPETHGSPLAALKAALKAPGMGHTPNDAIGVVLLDKFMDLADPLDKDEFFDACHEAATALGVSLHRHNYRPEGQLWRYWGEPVDGD